jgi:hypothetical protein
MFPLVLFAPILFAPIFCAIVFCAIVLFAIVLFARLDVVQHLGGRRAIAPSAMLRVMTFSILGLSAGAIAVGQEPVRFDAPLIVSADPLPWEHSGYQASIPGTQLVSIRIRMSAQVPARTQERLDELLFQVRSGSGQMRVVDHWPRTQTVSHVQGPIDVSSTNYQQQHFSLRAIGGSPGVGTAQGSLQRDAVETLQRTYAEKPKLATHLSSGTLDRGSGVFWQLRPSPEQSIEGDRDYWLLCEVPQNWKGDLLEVTADAAASPGNAKPSSRPLGSRRFMVAVYLANHVEAYQKATRFVEYERRLRQSAVRYQQQISQRQAPTPLHRLAQSLELSEPAIPKQWLDYVLFEPDVNYIDDKTAELPVDVRVAILDYIDNKQALLKLATVR